LENFRKENQTEAAQSVEEKSAELLCRGKVKELGKKNGDSKEGIAAERWQGRKRSQNQGRKKVRREKKNRR